MDGKKAPSPSLPGEPHGLSSPQLMSSQESSLREKRRPLILQQRAEVMCSQFCIEMHFKRLGKVKINDLTQQNALFLIVFRALEARKLFWLMQ